jgi:hypothetical protein
MSPRARHTGCSIRLMAGFMCRVTSSSMRTPSGVGTTTTWRSTVVNRSWWSISSPSQEKKGRMTMSWHPLLLVVVLHPLRRQTLQLPQAYPLHFKPRHQHKLHHWFPNWWNSCCQGPQPRTTDSNLDTDNEGAARYRLIDDLRRNTRRVETCEVEHAEFHVKSADEPSTFVEAISNPCWKKAMEEEMDSIISNKTWSLEELPTGH